MNKKIKEKSKEDILSDILNYHISKGNILETRINENHKDKINASNLEKFAKTKGAKNKTATKLKG